MHRLVIAAAFAGACSGSGRVAAPRDARPPAAATPEQAWARPRAALEPSVAIMDYRATDDSERVIAGLLEASEVPYHLERSRGGWGYHDVVRLVVTVRGADVYRVDELLRAVAVLGQLELVHGTADLYNRWSSG